MAWIVEWVIVIELDGPTVVTVRQFELGLGVAYTDGKFKLHVDLQMEGGAIARTLVSIEPYVLVRLAMCIIFERRAVKMI
jgi:hypothetical protein